MKKTMTALTIIGFALALTAPTESFAKGQNRGVRVEAQSQASVVSGRTAHSVKGKPARHGCGRGWMRSHAN